MSLIQMPVVHLTKLHCQQCKKSFHPDETIAGICGYCWQNRLASAEKLAPGEFANDYGQKCFECGMNIFGCGYMIWDNLAAQFKIACLSCGDRQHRTDDQFHGTAFAYQGKLQ